MNLRALLSPHLAAGSALFLAVILGPAAAMEGGQTPTVRGYRDFLSGALPQPGVYVREDTYIYRGTERSTMTVFGSSPSGSFSPPVPVM